MSLQNALNLISDIDTDSNLRNSLYSFNTSNEVYNYLSEKGYSFLPNEMEDAINSLHVKCQTLEAAQDLMHKAELLKYLLKII